jgi:hypothetical protein
MKLLLEKIQYEEYNWNIYGDLKVIALLHGLQLGYTKFCCFLYEWDSRDSKYHYIQKQWPKRELLIPGNKNVVNTPLISTEKVYLPPSHIKLGLIKIFVKAMDQNGAGFMYLENKYPRISDAKIKEGVFVASQIRELIQKVKFEDQLSEVEKSERKSFKNIATNFLGKS